MAYEFYVTIEGTKQGKFKGDNRSKAHKDQITGLAFDYEITSPRDPASGLPTGKRQHKPVTITKRLGAATPQLFQALVTNEVLKSVKIEFEKISSSGKEYVYHRITLTDATISDIHQHAAADTRELEEVSFTFHKIEIENVDGKTIAIDDWSSGPA
jgi:type VI secretion system secreted protein Hcp